MNIPLLPAARRWAGAALVLIPMAGLDPAHAQTAAAADRWTYSITPYLWLPGLDGTFKYALPPGTGSPDVSVNENRVLEALDFAFMIAGEARRGRTSLFADYIYLKLSTSNSAIRAIDFNTGAPVNPFNTTVNRETATRIEGNVLTLAAGYQLGGAADAPLDVIGGVRFFGVKTRSDWQLSAAVAGPGPGQVFAATGGASRNEDLWDVIVGTRGRVRIADRWFVPYYLDVGGGSSKLTWQALAGLGYSFGWGDISLSWRHLFYDQSDDKLMQDFKFSGGMLGATFRF